MSGVLKFFLFNFKTAMCVLSLSSYPVFLLTLSFFRVSIILIQLCLCVCNVDISVSFFSPYSFNLEILCYVVLVLFVFGIFDKFSFCSVLFCVEIFLFHSLPKIDIIPT